MHHCKREYTCATAYCAHDLRDCTAGFRQSCGDAMELCQRRLLLVFLVLSVAASDLRRVRLRSGEYPAASASEDVDETLARVGGLGGSPMPAGCQPWLHRPDIAAQSGFHPMQLASTVLILAGPVGVTRFATQDWKDSTTGRHERYLPDHRRYSRGGSLWVFNWQLRGESTDELAEGEQTTWLGRAMLVIAATRAIAEPHQYHTYFYVVTFCSWSVFFDSFPTSSL